MCCLGLANPSWQPLPGGRCVPGSPALGALSCPQAPRRAPPWCPPSSLDQEGVARAALVQVTPPCGCGRPGARMHAPEWLEAKFTTVLLGVCTPAALHPAITLPRTQGTEQTLNGGRAAEGPPGPHIGPGADDPAGPGPAEGAGPPRGSGPGPGGPRGSSSSSSPLLQLSWGRRAGVPRPPGSEISPAWGPRSQSVEMC